MSVEIHVACRQDPSVVGEVLRSCRVARVELWPSRSIHAWSPRAHATLLLRERDVAGVVTFRVDGPAELATEYAALVARAFQGVAVVDGEVVEPFEHHPLSAGELAAAWQVLDGRTSRVLEAREALRRRRQDRWERRSSSEDVARV